MSSEPVLPECLKAVVNAVEFWKEGVSNSKRGSTDIIAKESGWGDNLHESDGGTTDWCGLFVGTCLMRAGLDVALRRGFFHVRNVEHYFRYDYGERIPRWLWDEAVGAWKDVKTYHTEREALRAWHHTPAIGTGLDMLPGDVVLIDHEGDGKANHITMAESYDPSTGMLVTLEGNGLGAIAVALLPDGAVQEGVAKGPSVVRNKRDLTNDHQRRKIYGWGRLSPVDFERHGYDFDDAKPRHPPPLA